MVKPFGVAFRYKYRPPLALRYPSLASKKTQYQSWVTFYLVC